MTRQYIRLHSEQVENDSKQFMNASPFQSFDTQFAGLNQFVLQLVEEYRLGKIKTWDDLDERVKIFFTPEKMSQIESMAPGWKKMASYADGITLTHVTCVFLGLFMLPEFQELTPPQQQLAKWIVLFHDIEKIHNSGKRDNTHAFRSAITTARTLSGAGFPTTDGFANVIDSWSEFTTSAVMESAGQPGEQISDNSKLPEIVAGIEEMYGTNTPAASIIKGVLLHMSIDVVRDWPQPAPLSDEEIVRYIDIELAPLLKVMHLADSEGWSMFEPRVRAIQREETLETFQNVEKMIRK